MKKKRLQGFAQLILSHSRTFELKWRKSKQIADMMWCGNSSRVDGRDNKKKPPRN